MPNRVLEGGSKRVLVVLFIPSVERDAEAMKRKPRLDMNKIAKMLGTERGGRVTAKSGYFGALQLAAEVQSRFRIPSRGGRATDPQWTERRLVPLAAGTLANLEQLARKLKKDHGIVIAPLQLAALLLEHATCAVDEHEAEQLAREHAGHKKTA